MTRTKSSSLGTATNGQIRCPLHIHTTNFPPTPVFLGQSLASYTPPKSTCQVRKCRQKMPRQRWPRWPESVTIFDRSISSINHDIWSKAVLNCPGFRDRRQLIVYCSVQGHWLGWARWSILKDCAECGVSGVITECAIQVALIDP